LLSNRDDRKLPLKKESFRIAGLVSRDDMYVHVRYMLTGPDTIILKDVYGTRSEGPLHSACEVFHQSVHTRNLRIRGVKYGFAVLFRYDQHCASFVLAMIDERRNQIVLGYENALAFSGYVLTEAARIIRGDLERHQNLSGAFFLYRILDRPLLAWSVASSIWTRSFMN
jgi:hypothetical protein